MAEQEFEIMPVGIEYLCDACGEGKMVLLEIEALQSL